MCLSKATGLLSSGMKLELNGFPILALSLAGGRDDAGGVQEAAAVGAGKKSRQLKRSDWIHVPNVFYFDLSMSSVLECTCVLHSYMCVVSYYILALTFIYQPMT